MCVLLLIWKSLDTRSPHCSQPLLADLLFELTHVLLQEFVGVWLDSSGRCCLVEHVSIRIPASQHHGWSIVNGD